MATPLDTEQYEDQLAVWLTQASVADIQNYCKNLSEKDFEEVEVYARDILSRLRFRRATALTDLLQSNVGSLMDETNMLFFITDLSQYDPASVLQSFKQKYPALTSGVLSPTISTWATQYLNEWSNLFYFMTAQKYFNYLVYIKSFYKLQVDAATTQNLYVVVHAHLKSVVDYLASSNYEKRPLPTALQKEIMDYLTALTFLPASYCQELAYGTSGMKLFNLLEDLDYVLGFMASTMEVKPDITQESMARILHDALAADRQQKEMKDYNVQVALRQSTGQLDPGTKQRFELFNQLITIPNIQSDYCQKYLHNYLVQLTGEQKQLFLNDLADYLRLSTEIQTLFDPVDVDFFISKLQSESLTENKADFVKSLESRIVPDFWPITQKAMLMMATLF